MNGEIYQLARITAAARYALTHGHEVHFTLDDKTPLLIFRHKAEAHWWGYKRPPVSQSVEAWYKECRRRGLCDIKLKIPLGINAPYELGFANMSRGEILCYHKNGKVTGFQGMWRFHQEQHRWHVIHDEEARSALPPKPILSDNTQAFLSALEGVRELALELGFPFFAQQFGAAADILSGDTEDPKSNDTEHLRLPDTAPLSLLPEPNLRLMKAAYVADMFGAMGSWNDGPPCYAHEKGLEDVYKQRSAELLKQIRTAVMFAVNEW